MNRGGSGERYTTLLYKSNFKVGRILALFIETGVLYIVFMVYHQTSVSLTNPPANQHDI